MAGCPEELQTIAGHQGAPLPSFGGHIRDSHATGSADGSRARASIRPFGPRDEPAALGLLGAAFGRWPREPADGAPEEFFRWKHTGSPFGRSLMLVAELQGAVVGFYAYMPWLLCCAGRIVPTMRGVDLVVDPAHRRHGISLALRTAVEFSPEVVLTWGNPNGASIIGSRSLRENELRLHSFVRPGPALPGTLLRLAARRPARALAPIDAPTAAEALADDPLLDRLELRSAPPEARLATLRSDAFLRWRYGSSGDYRAVLVESRARAGLAIFRRIRRGPFAVASVCELLLERRDARLERRLLREVGRAADVDFVACALSSRGEGAARGLLAYRSRESLTMRPRSELALDPRDAGSWALSRGDLEII